MAPNGIINLPLEFSQVDRLGGNAAVSRRFVPRGDKVTRIRTSFDYDENLIHIQQYRTANTRFPVLLRAYYASPLEARIVSLSAVVASGGHSVGRRRCIKRPGWPKTAAT